MSSIKASMASVLAAAFVFIGGCGETDNQGELDDSQMSDQVPGTTGDTTGTPNDPMGTPNQSDDMTGMPGDTGSPGAGTDPTMDPGAADPNDPNAMDQQGGTMEDPQAPAQ